MKDLPPTVEHRDDEPPIGKLDFVTTEDAQTILEALLDTSNSEPFVITILLPYPLPNEVIDVPFPLLVDRLPTDSPALINVDGSRTYRTNARKTSDVESKQKAFLVDIQFIKGATIMQGARVFCSPDIYKDLTDD